VVRADSQTGRLVRHVRTTVVAPRVIEPARVTSNPAGVQPSSPLGAAIDINGMIEDAAKTHSVDPLLVHSIIQVESAYNPYAISPKGAEGLMQLIPATAKRFGVANSFDAKANIEAGVKYLKYLQERFGDDRLALAAYNAGEGAVEKYGRNIPPYRETEDYVFKVGKRYGEARTKARRNAPSATTAAPQPAVMTERPAEETPLRKLDLFTDSEGRVHLRTR